MRALEILPLINISIKKKGEDTTQHLRWGSMPNKNGQKKKKERKRDLCIINRKGEERKNACMEILHYLILLNSSGDSRFKDI